MERSWISKVLCGACVAAALGTLCAASFGDTPITSFTPGDVVILRGGDATNPDTATTTSQVALYLDEYTAGGAYVGTINVPSSGGSALTIPGIGDFQHDGVLSLSTNGQYLTFAGYQVDAGSSDAFAAGGADQPVIGIIGASGAGLSTNTIVDSYTTGSANPFIRGAVSNDGNEFWTFGKYGASGGTTNGGLAYVSSTGATATTTTVEGFADWRDITIAGGQLYGGTGSSSVGNHGPYQISTGEPTTNLGSSLTNNTQLGNYPGGQSASALALVDEPGDPNSTGGLNVLYTIGDQSTPGIVKYYYNGTTWVNQTNVELDSGASNVLNPTGLVAVPDPGNANWVDITITGTNGLYTYVDKTGYSGAISADAFTLEASAPTNEAFYGVAVIPVPEPASVALLAVGAVALLSRRRRRAQGMAMG